jgi:hypothetical protein
MRHRVVMVLSLLLWFVGSGMASAETPPAKVVQQFIEAHLQGRFATAHGFAIEGVNVRDSLFSNWLFGSSDIGVEAPTADVFLSRKFAQAFQYNILGTNRTGENQVQVTVMRTTPNLTHMYTWALVPKRGATPYELIGAIDAYLTKVNFPVEESRMEFTLIREAGEWYISAVHDEKFVKLQQLGLAQQPLSTAVPSASALPPASPPGVPSTTSPQAAAPSGNVGRQIADAQFNATLQSFNRNFQSGAAQSAPQAQEQEDDGPSFLGKVASLFGLGKKGNTLAKVEDQGLKQTFRDIRNAMQRYAVANDGRVPDQTQIYDWQSLRHLVERYSKTSLPATEDEAGFQFVQYRVAPGRDDYTLLLELHEPQDGTKRVEVTQYGVDRAK